jgi:hypothetical protein
MPLAQGAKPYPQGDILEMCVFLGFSLSRRVGFGNSLRRFFIV